MIALGWKSLFTNAPTARFKTNVGTFGSDTKAYLSGEWKEKFRCPTAEDVYKQCRDLMPLPRDVTDENRELEKCDERHHAYLVDEKDASEDQRNNSNVIVTNSADESWDCTALVGIKRVDALRGYRGAVVKKVQTLSILIF